MSCRTSLQLLALLSLLLLFDRSFTLALPISATPNANIIVTDTSNTPSTYTFTNCTLHEVLQLPHIARLTELLIDGCNITTLPNAFFIRFTSLQTLELSDSQINTMEDYALHGLSQLKFLSLARNNLTEMKSWSNEQLNALQVLDLRHNAIAALTLKSFIRFPNLQRLNLAQNLLADIDDGIFRWMPHLKYLNLGHNRLCTIDARNFHGMHRLTHLALHYNQIAHIESASFASNTHLRSLRLEGNQVMDLDFLRSNALVRLVHLNLSHNLIDTLQGLDFSKEYELADLDMSYNRLTQVLKDTFAGLEAIVHLNISHNALYNVEAHSFDDLVNLESVDMSANNLSALPAHLFATATQLQCINLSRNALSSIDEALLAPLPYLNTLDLSHNQLTSDTFITQLAPALHLADLTLDLSENHYSWLNTSALIALRSVELAGNWWQCQWLIEQMLRAPPHLHYGRNYSLVSTWSAALLNVSGIYCYDAMQQRNIIVLDAGRMWERRYGDIVQCVTPDPSIPTPPPLVWPRVKLDRFDSRSIIIWMLIAIALAFAGLRTARQLIDKREQRRRAMKLRAKELAAKGTESEQQKLKATDAAAQEANDPMAAYENEERTPVGS